MKAAREDCAKDDARAGGSAHSKHGWKVRGTHTRLPCAQKARASAVQGFAGHCDTTAMLVREDEAEEATKERTEAAESGGCGNPTEELTIADEAKSRLDAWTLEDPADEGATGIEETVRLEEGNDTPNESAVLEGAKEATDTPEEGATEPALATLDLTEPRETEARDVAYGHAARHDSMVR